MDSLLNTQCFPNEAIRTNLLDHYRLYFKYFPYFLYDIIKLEGNSSHDKSFFLLPTFWNRSDRGKTIKTPISEFIYFTNFGHCSLKAFLFEAVSKSIDRELRFHSLYIRNIILLHVITSANTLIIRKRRSVLLETINIDKNLAGTYLLRMGSNSKG